MEISQIFLLLKYPREKKSIFQLGPVAIVMRDLWNFNRFPVAVEPKLKVWIGNLLLLLSTSNHTMHNEIIIGIGISNINNLLVKVSTCANSQNLIAWINALLITFSILFFSRCYLIWPSHSFSFIHPIIAIIPSTDSRLYYIVHVHTNLLFMPPPPSPPSRF